MKFVESQTNNDFSLRASGSNWSEFVPFSFGGSLVSAVALLLVIFLITPSKTLGQACTPTGGSICIAGDDNSTAYVNGVLVGTVAYCNWDGTGACPPMSHCLAIPASAFTMGTSVCLAIKTQNTAPQDTFSSWMANITCSGGGNSVVTSSSGSIQGYYVNDGTTNTPDPAAGGNGNPWFSPGYNGGLFTGSPVVMTGQAWSQPLYDPSNGTQIPYIANNASGDSGTSTGALFWRQCVTLTKTVILGPPSLAITKSACGAAVTNTGANTITATYCLVVCNSGQA
ncbi:MAG TPA: hypothetical protein VIJ93_03435, partial [bacterium]